MTTRRLHTFIYRLTIMKTMNKILLVFSFYLGGILAVTVEPFYRHSVVSPHAANEGFYTGSDRQILAPAPVVETSGPVEAQAAPVSAIVSAPSLAFSAPVAPFAALVAPVTAPVSVASTAPIAAKVVQFKSSYPQYAYGYSVQDFTTGDNKAAKEVREGGKVKGSYSVADPDGTKRTVNYYADPIHGFNAVVHKTQIL